MAPPINRNRAGLLCGLACCCICCIIPGIITMVTASFQYEDWESAQAEVMNTTYCGTYRRRRKLGREIVQSDAAATITASRTLLQRDDSTIISGDLDDSNKDSTDGNTIQRDSKILRVNRIPSVETRKGSFQSFSIQALFVGYDDDDNKSKKVEQDDMDSSDDSDDDEDDASEDEKEPKNSGSNSDAPVISQTTTTYSTSNMFVTKQKNNSRRRTTQQQQIHGVQRRAKGGGVAAGAAGGAATGYYFGSSGNRHNSHYRSSSSSKGPQYSTTYSFMTLDGENVTATTEYCMNPVPPVGGTETVLYNPDSPTVGVVSQGFKEGLQGDGINSLIIGLVSVAIIGACLYFVMRRRKPSSHTSTNTNTIYSNNNNNNNAFSSSENTYSTSNYSDNKNPHDDAAAVEKPQYGEPPIVQAQEVTNNNTGPISYTSAAYKPP